MALHDLFDRNELVLGPHNLCTFDVFLVVEWAFDNTSFEAMAMGRAYGDHEVHSTISR
jgi:hypothetical protein